MDNRHNLSDESAPWGNDITRRVDALNRAYSLLEEDRVNLGKAQAHVQAQLNPQAGVTSEVVSYELSRGATTPGWSVYDNDVLAPEGATQVVARTNNFQYLGGSTGGGGYLFFDFVQGGDPGTPGPEWEVSASGTPLGVSYPGVATLELQARFVTLLVTYVPNGTLTTRPQFRHNIHLMWRFA